jgi:hypothetical protein
LRVGVRRVVLTKVFRQCSIKQGQSCRMTYWKVLT